MFNNNFRAILAVSLLSTSMCQATPPVLASTSSKPVGASSFEAGHAPGNAVSSGTTAATGWVASTSTFPQWLVIDLGAIYTLTSIHQTFAASDLWSFKIEGSNDNYVDDSYWTTLADETSGVAGQSFTLPVSGSFRYIRLYVTNAQSNAASSTGLSVAGHITTQSSASVPRPQRAASGGYTIGVQACNLWANKMDWQTLADYPDRVSIMGSYNEAYDISTDWQIKMAVEHGISFIQPCWFRQQGNEGAPTVMASFDHFLNSLANSAHYRSMLKFDIDWVNTGPAVGGSSGVADFVNNLVPYWINTYFSKPNYLTMYGKPVLAIYDFETFITQMGGLANAKSAIQSFRAAVAKAGYPGLYLETQQSGSTTPAGHWVVAGDPRGVSTMFGNYYTKDYAHTNADAAAAGFDFVFAYHLPTFTDLMVSKTPSDTEVMAEQTQAWSNWKQYSAVPTIVTASMGWNAAPWAENNDSWKLSTADWQSLLANNAKAAMAARVSGLSSKVIMLDNWNEYAEGHYIAPTSGDGYGYLDGVAAAFSPNWTASTAKTVDVTPNQSTIPQVLTPAVSSK